MRLVLAAVALCLVPSAANGALLYEQVGSGTNAAISFDFPTALDIDDNQGADDFTVPAGERGRSNQ